MATEADMEALKAMLLAHPDIRLVIFDPITGFFGCDQNKDQELRPVMNRLKEVCEETGVTVIAVSHHNKKSDLDALKQILGASSFAAAARVVWMVSRDPDAKDTRHMTVAKLNIGKEQGGLQFEVQETVIHADGEDITTSTIEWQGVTDYTADSLLARGRDKAKEGGTGVDRALVYLTAKFNDHWEYKCTDLYAEGEAEGISDTQLKRAKAKLGGVGSDKRQDGWWWIRVKTEEQPITMAAGEGL